MCLLPPLSPSPLPHTDQDRAPALGSSGENKLSRLGRGMIEHPRQGKRNFPLGSVLCISPVLQSDCLPHHTPASDHTDRCRKWSFQDKNPPSLHLMLTDTHYWQEMITVSTVIFLPGPAQQRNLFDEMVIRRTGFDEPHPTLNILVNLIERDTET